MSLFAELQRRSVFKVGAAYLVVGWLLVQAASIAFPAFDAPPSFLRGFILLVLLGFPLALVLAWAFEVTPEGVKLDAAGAGSKRMFAAAALIAALVVGWFLRGGVGGPAPVASTAVGVDATAGRGTAPRSIAVLPFVSMSAAQDNEYFADGISEEILNSLAHIADLQVVGRTSSFQFKGQNLDLREVGGKLGVATVLEGSVRREGERARITAQLVRVADGFHLWSQTYDRTVKDSLAVQLDIAEHVADALDVVLDDDQRARMREAGVSDVDAFIAFQHGRRIFNDAHDPALSTGLIADLRRGKREFDKALAIDPDYAQALLLGSDLYGHEVFSDLPLGERKAALARAVRDLAHAERVAPDPLTRELAAIDRTMYSDDWSELGRHIDRVTGLAGCAQGNWSMVVSIFGRERARQVTDWMERRTPCDPLERNSYQRAGEAALYAGEPARALEIVARGEQAIGPNELLNALRVRALLVLGRTAEATSAASGLTDAGPRTALERIFVAAASGEGAAAIKQRIARFNRGVWYPELWALVDYAGFAATGDRAAADRWAAATDAEPAGPMRILVTSYLCMCGLPFDRKVAPRLEALVAQAGLPWPPQPILPANAMLGGGR